MRPRPQTINAVLLMVATALAFVVVCLAGCRFTLSRDELTVDFGYTHANIEAALRVNQPDGPTTSPAPDTSPAADLSKK